jgi:putative PIN family toxin of toxin-antitoxin system
MKLTPDTNFLISATQWDYSVCHKLLQKLIIENTEIFTTEEILIEFREILARDFDRDISYTKNLIDFLKKFILIIEPEEKLFIITSDPADNKILECAIASNSDYIITYDNHLLLLREFRGIKIVKPEFLLNT